MATNPKKATNTENTAVTVSMAMADTAMVGMVITATETAIIPVRTVTLKKLISL